MFIIHLQINMEFKWSLFKVENLIKIMETIITQICKKNMFGIDVELQ